MKNEEKDAALVLRREAAVKVEVERLPEEREVCPYCGRVGCLNAYTGINVVVEPERLDF